LSLTNSQLLSRIEVIELAINDLETAVSNLATRREMKNLVALIQAQITSLQDVVGTVDATGALYPPRYTTTERDALTVTDGAIIINISLNKVQVYIDSAWANLN
jgi:hypothetical protein